jgi:cyclase
MNAVAGFLRCALIGSMLWSGCCPAQVLQGPGFGVDFASVGLEMQPVAGRVYMLSGAGGNIGVFAGSDGVVLVDDQFAPLSERIRNEVRVIDQGPIRFVINTHFHGDHTGGNGNFGIAGATIVAHENVRKTLARPHYIEMIDTRFAAFRESALPVVTFRDSVTLHLNGERVDVMHAPPSHTDGDSIVYFRGSDVVHMGDIFRARGQPIFDRRNGGSYQGLIAAADWALGIIGESTKIIPGHGAVSSKADLRKSRDIMAAVRDRVAAGIARGESLEAVLADDPSAGFDWRDGRLTVAETIEWIYRELAAKSR